MAGVVYSVEGEECNGTPINTSVKTTEETRKKRLAQFLHALAADLEAAGCTDDAAVIEELATTLENS